MVYKSGFIIYCLDSFTLSLYLFFLNSKKMYPHVHIDSISVPVLLWCLEPYVQLLRYLNSQKQIALSVFIETMYILVKLPLGEPINIRGRTYYLDHLKRASKITLNGVTEKCEFGTNLGHRPKFEYTKQ